MKKNGRTQHKSPWIVIVVLLMAACQPATEALESSTRLPPTATPTPPPTPTASPSSVPAVNRIGIRTVSGSAEFYDTVTGKKFIPRGVNYVDFREVAAGQLWEDYIFGAGTYQPEKVRQAFRRMAGSSYNTVRLFFDHCFRGPSCIGSQTGNGLNPSFLDNMVEVMAIAAEEGVYLILTANGVPYDGGYWARYGLQFNQQDHFGFDEFYGNGYYLHAAGVEMQEQYWRDLMSGLAERKAPFNVVLGWQLQNEHWLFKKNPPLSLESGLVSISNGQTYDLSDPDEKRRMVTEGTIFWMETLIPVIKEFAPGALVTVGYFPPDFPNDNQLAADWYRDTAPLMAVAPVDFWDFHPYPEPRTNVNRSMKSAAENFGMVGYQEKPVLMGEYGAFRHIFPNLEIATLRLQEWMAESCEFGFDGWLLWEYYNRPADDAVWGLENDVLFDALAPVNAPEACSIVPLPPDNLAFDKVVTASRSMRDTPPENAVDGADSPWNSGADGPQWIEVDLGQVYTIRQIRLWVAQYPEGNTVHLVYVRDSGGKLVEVHRFEQFTRGGDWLTFEPENPLQGVSAVRIKTLQSPSWVAWAEIEVYGDKY